MNIEKEREAFEQFCIKDDEFCIHRYAGDSSYSDDYTQCAWLAWLASANREGYKLVPLEPSKSCLNNLGDVIFDNFGTTTTEVDRCAEKAYKAMIGACDE